MLPLVARDDRGGSKAGTRQAPVGISTIAAGIDADKDTIESIYEPFLMRIGFLERILRGRKLTAKAFRHLGFAPPADRTLPAPIKQKKK